MEVANTKNKRLITYEANQAFTNSIIKPVLEKLVNGIVPWRQGVPKITFAMNYVTGEEYRGLSWFMLNCIASLDSPYYLTWDQIKTQEGRVTKGSKALHYYYHEVQFKNVKGELISQVVAEKLERGGKQITQLFQLRKFPIFNQQAIQQIEFKPMLLPDGGFSIQEECEVILESMLLKPDFHINKDHKTLYTPETDRIDMPSINEFKGREVDIFASLFTSLIHWTGHESRLGREAIVNRLQSRKPGYELEHLIGELGAMYLCGYVGIDRSRLIESNQKYISFWKSKLESEPSLLLEATRQAQEAVDYILHR